MFSSVKKIIQDAKKGKIFILVDDKNRENHINDLERFANENGFYNDK